MRWKRYDKLNEIEADRKNASSWAANSFGRDRRLKAIFAVLFVINAIARSFQTEVVIMDIWQSFRQWFQYSTIHILNVSFVFG